MTFTDPGNAVVYHCNDGFIVIFYLSALKQSFTKTLGPHADLA